MDAPHEQTLVVDITEFSSPVSESDASTSNTEVNDEREQTSDPPPGLPDKDEFMEVILKAAMAPSHQVSAMICRTGLIASALQVPPLPPQRITIHLVRHAEGPHNLISIPEKERVAMLDPFSHRIYIFTEALLVSFNTWHRPNMSILILNSILTEISAFFSHGRVEGLKAGFRGCGACNDTGAEHDEGKPRSQQGCLLLLGTPSFV